MKTAIKKPSIHAPYRDQYLKWSGFRPGVPKVPFSTFESTQKLETLRLLAVSIILIQAKIDS